MARYTPTQEPPDSPQEDGPPPDYVPINRELLYKVSFALAIVLVLVGAFLLVARLTIPRTPDNSRFEATVSANQTLGAVTATNRALTPQPTRTPQPAATPAPAAKPTVAPTAPVQAPARPAVDTAPVPLLQGQSTPPELTLPLAGQTPITFETGDPVPRANTPRPAPTLDTVSQAEVIQAYMYYWRQRTLALRDLDASRLDEVAAGPELAGLTRGIEQLRAEGRAIRTRIRHELVAEPTAPNEAVVTDEYEDLSTWIDAETLEPLDPTRADPEVGPMVKVHVVLQKLDGVWKVTGGRRYD